MEWNQRAASFFGFRVRLFVVHRFMLLFGGLIFFERGRLLVAFASHVTSGPD